MLARSGGTTMPDSTRRALVTLIAAFGLLVPGGHVRADDYPSRLVKVIVPFPPRSTLDVLLCIITEEMARKWGQPVIIENISGGAGTIGTEKFSRTDPDGYTLL